MQGNETKLFFLQQVSNSIYSKAFFLKTNHKQTKIINATISSDKMYHG